MRYVCTDAQASLHSLFRLLGPGKEYGIPEDQVDEADAVHSLHRAEGEPPAPEPEEPPASDEPHDDEDEEEPTPA